MDKTTVYLPDDLKAAVKRAAKQRGVSEAEVIRESIRMGVSADKPRPRGALYSGREPIARRMTGLLLRAGSHLTPHTRVSGCGG